MAHCEKRSGAHLGSRPGSGGVAEGAESETGLRNWAECILITDLAGDHDAQSEGEPNL